MTMPNTTPAAASGRQPTAREQFREIKDEAVGQARDTVRQARDRAASSLGESKTRLVDQASNLARAFHQTSDRLRGEDQTRVADLTDSLARQADQIAAYLRDRDARAMRQDLERLARRRPAVFASAAFALGLLGARFLKSSERREREGDGRARAELPETPVSTMAPSGAGGSYAGA